MTAKLALLQVVQRGSDKGWSVVVHRHIVYVLTAYYILHILFLLGTTKWLWSRSTGLRAGWDPTSLADIIALFQPFRNDDLLNTKDTRYRLGYWRRIEGSRTTVVYGIRSRHPNRHFSLSSTTQWCGFLAPSASPYQRFPILWNSLGEGGINLVLLGGAVLVTATWTGILASPLRSRVFLVTNGAFHWANTPSANNTIPVNANLTASGQWSPFLAGPERAAANLQLWNFVLRGLPQLFMSAALNISALFDLFYLYCQPFVDMYRGPCSASDSILLDYLTISPLKVLLEAHGRGHWKVLYFKALALLAPLAQLAPISVLTLVGAENAIWGQFSISALATSVAVMAIYLASYAWTRCSQSRLMPSEGTNLSDLWKMCSTSRFAQNPVFGECGPSWTKEDLVATLQLQHDRYMFGYTGTCTVCLKPVFGFDAAELSWCGLPTSRVWHVDPRNAARKAHCHRCAKDPDYHEQGAIRVREEGIFEHYLDWPRNVVPDEWTGAHRPTYEDVLGMRRRMRSAAVERKATASSFVLTSHVAPCAMLLRDS